VTAALHGTFTTPAPRRDIVPHMQDGHGLLDISSATEAELCDLVGVGPALAARIVEWREQHGGFASVDQLAEVRGIGPSKLDLLRAQVTVAPQVEVIEDAEFEELEDVVVPAARVRAAPRRDRLGPRRVLAGRRLPAVMDAGGRSAEADRSFAAFLRDNTASLALVGLAVAAQLLVIVLIVWVL
jgi:competence ComEA-like helix-hairpin-helix protein